MKIKIGFVMVLVMAIITSACGKSTTIASKEDSSTLRLSDSGEIQTLDTAKGLDGSTVNATNSVMEGLFMPNVEGDYIPAAAKSYTLSDDKKTYTFSLQETKWSNGDKVTAQDFVFAWKKVVDPTTASQFAYLMYDVKNAQAINEGKQPVETLGVKAIDDDTLEVQLEHPVPYFLAMTSVSIFFPQNEAFVKEQGKQYGLEANTTLYNGPYVVSEWNHGSGFVMKKNEQYWDKKSVKTDTIDVRVIKDISTAVNLYETGKLDQATLSSDFVSKYENSKEKKTVAIPITTFLRLNEENTLLKNEKVRKAISMVIDKENITDDILQDGSVPMDYLVPKGLVVKDDVDYRDEAVLYEKQDSNEAKAVWKEAKAELGVEGGELRLLTEDTGMYKETAEFLKEQIESQLDGLTVSIQQLPTKAKTEAETTLAYDISISRWGADYPDPMTYLNMFTSDSPLNKMAYKNEKYNDLIEAARGKLLLDEEKRTKTLKEAESLLLGDTAIIPLYQNGTVYVEKESVHDMLVRPFVGYFAYKYAYKTE